MEIKKAELYQMGGAVVSQLKNAERDEDTSITNFMGYSMRVVGLAGGLGTIFCAFLGFFTSITRLAVYAYVGFFGIIIVTLEMSDLICANSFKAWIEKDLKFLSVLLGRGIFHCFVGSLLFWQWGFFPIIVGCFEIFIGIVMVLVSVTTTQKLSSVKRGIIKDMHGDAMASFAKYDKDGSGYIDSREFVALSKEHGINLNENEVSAAINLLDTNRDGRISKEEFGVFLTTKRATHFFGFK